MLASVGVLLLMHMTGRALCLSKDCHCQCHQLDRNWSRRRYWQYSAATTKETQTISVCTLHGQCPRTGRQQTTGLEKLLSHYIDTVNACDTKLADICRQKESAAACLFVWTHSGSSCQLRSCRAHIIEEWTDGTSALCEECQTNCSSH